VKPGFLRSIRAPKRASCQDVSKVENAAILLETSSRSLIREFYSGNSGTVGETDSKSKHRLEVITAEGFIEFVNSWLVFD
jgi:hypothetical protein